MRASKIVARVLIGFLVAIVIITAARIWLARDTRSRLTREAFQEAALRWEQNGPDSYELQVELLGSRNDRIVLEVRDGQAVRMTIDGNPIERAHGRESWTVPSQLAFIREDLDAAADAANAEQIIMKAEFHPQLGYPLSYYHSELGTGLVRGWKLVRFDALEGE